MVISRILTKFSILSICIATLLACSTPQAGPDKSIGGALLGAGWGAGAGAVVGNQVSTPGKGVAVGSGFGAVAGLLMGLGYDFEEEGQIKQGRKLENLQVQSVANQYQLEKIQARLDSSLGGDPIGGVYTVFFDEDQTNLRLAAITNLESIVEALKESPTFHKVRVAGHTDDTGQTRYNEKLARSRAETVASYLAARGVANDQIVIESFSASRPVATNRTAAGRQLNRRAEISLIH